MKQHFDRKAWKFDKDKKPTTADKNEVNLGRRGLVVAGLATVAGSFGAGFLGGKFGEKSNTQTLQEFHRAWHEKTLAELEKGNGELSESIKQQISRHLAAQDWCHSQIRTLEYQLSRTDDEATRETVEEFMNNYMSQTGFFTDEIRRLSKPILEHHKKHNLPVPEGIPLPDERVPGQEHTSL